MESKPSGLVTAGVTDGLLIEPVWNRNTDADITAATSGLAFNRTSMESKLLHSGFCESVNRLLIEPVWNRNI